MKSSNNFYFPYKSGKNTWIIAPVKGCKLPSMKFNVKAFNKMITECEASSKEITTEDINMI